MRKTAGATRHYEQNRKVTVTLTLTLKTQELASVLVVQGVSSQKGPTVTLAERRTGKVTKAVELLRASVHRFAR